ncbi:MAG: outer membrane lipoprotein carrier protein LolA [Proteiniphilum sp.]|nr:outer membrane lipoprotein carrier protein LolA [Proteiniphilum sp.]
MMKRNILTIAALLFAFVASAQSPGEAKTILDKAYTAYEASQGIILSFTSTTMEADGTTYMTQTGKAFIKGDRFKLEMEAMNIWFDGETQWVWLKDVDEVNISNPTGQEIAVISPLALLGMYKNGYTLKTPLSQTVNGKKVHLLEMVPAVTNKDFKAVSVAVEKSSHTLVQVILTMSNGMRNKIDITNYNANHKFSDAEFKFDKSVHPELEIVDLR